MSGGSRVAAVALLPALTLATLAWASLSGRLAGLPYADIPVVHPYPPAGRYVNPFTGDPRDLVSSAEAARVKADLLEDGRIELDALARGDASALRQAASGEFLTRVSEVVAEDNAGGVVELERHRIDSVIVGRLADPNQPAITWCVEEWASGETIYVSRSTGRAVETQRFRTVARFWLARVGDRYLIADADIADQWGSTR